MKRRPGSVLSPTSDTDYIFQNAQGLPIELSEEPTTEGNQLPNNGDEGFFGGSYYKNYFGTVYKFTGVPV